MAAVSVTNIFLMKTTTSRRTAHLPGNAVDSNFYPASTSNVALIMVAVQTAGGSGLINAGTTMETTL